MGYMYSGGNRYKKFISTEAPGSVAAPAYQIGGHSTDTGLVGSATHFGCVMGGVMQIYCDDGGTEITNTLSIGVEAGTVASAKVDITSTTQGFLPPRMTTTQRDAINLPASGLMIYNTTTNKINFYAASAWETITSS